MRAYLALVASLGLFACIDEGGQAGTYCRADRDCRGDLVCIASLCREMQTPTPPRPPIDAGPVDSGPVPVDAPMDSGTAEDAGNDAGMPEEDAGNDAGMPEEDAGNDAGTPERDAGNDAGTDAGG